MASSGIWNCVIRICFIQSLTATLLASLSSSITRRHDGDQHFWCLLLPGSSVAEKRTSSLPEVVPKVPLILIGSSWVTCQCDQSLLVTVNTWTNHCYQENTEFLLVRSGLGFWGRRLTPFKSHGARICKWWLSSGTQRTITKGRRRK